MTTTLQVQPTTTWNLDPNHADVQFAVKHLGLMTVRGHLPLVNGTAVTKDGKLESFEAVIDAKGINTRVADRDAHLRSPDFLNTDQFPEIQFKSTEITGQGGGNNYRVLGDLTLAGQTHPTVLEVEVTDPVKDPWGFTRSSATAHGTISRKDWGLTWNMALEAGGFVVGDEVKITIEVEGTAS